MPTRSVFCIAPSRGRADRIIDALKRAEFSKTGISVLFLDRVPTGATATGKGARASAGPASTESAGEIRGTMAWIAGIRALVIPGAGPLIAAGPIADALGEATLGGIAGGLIDFGVPSEEAGRYEARIKDGQIFISVHLDNPDVCDRARDIFTAAGAEEIFTIMEVPTPRPTRRDGHQLSSFPLA